MYIIENFNVHIEQLGRDRMVRVYLPEDYDEREDKRYAVLYMHDGHNLFFDDTASYGDAWRVQNAVNNIEKQGRDGIIVVGIDCNLNGGRLDEYSPWVNEDLSKLTPSLKLKKAGGEGEQYVEFIVKTLKPLIDNKYRTLKDRDNTFIAGSSMGGFISLYAGYKYKEVFSAIGAFSTAIWFKKDKLMEFIKENFKKGTKVYLDSGTKETSDDTRNDYFNNLYVEDTKDLEKFLLELGQDSKDLKVIIDEGATHCEAAWRRRFPVFLEWILQK